MKSAQYENTMAKLLGLGVPFVSVFLITGSVTDPVNMTKLLILGGIGFASLALFIFHGFGLAIETNRLLVLTSIAFVVFSLISVISSDLPLSQNLYGVYGRNTGFVAYFLLTGLLLGALTMRKSKSFLWLLWGLIFAGVLNVLYCGWVVFFGDFIGWDNPYGNILGLFGNPNFIGAFLGIWISTTIAFMLSPSMAKSKKLALGILILLAMYEVYKSHAVQGVVVTTAGTATVIFFYIRSKTKNWIPVSIYSVVVFGFGVAALFGALQKGPLAQYVYKTSVSLRGSYWNAGIQTGLNHPWSGVGMDGYGDWYRRSRSVHAATVMPGPNTVTNSAHNVIIDIFSYGGFPLLLSYLFLLALGATAIVRGIKRSRTYDPIFVALSVAWIGYQLQSVISINQIGLVVWGWVLTGALVAYTFSVKSGIENSEFKQSMTKSRNKRNTQSAVFSSPLVAGLGAVVGLIIACPPISADMAWVKAVRSSNLAEVEKALQSSYLHPSSSYQLVTAVGVMENSKLFDQSHKYALEATKFNPENFDSWYLLYSVSKSTAEERALALKNMKRLDPHNPDVTKR